MRASITVMMSLVSLIILAMTGTCIETARYSVCAGSGTESLRSAADALFTEYSRPLYDHYGLFFLESVGTPHEEVISRYLGDDLEGGAGFLDFLKGELKSLDIRKKTLAGDDGAEPLMKEIVQYMERYVVSEALGGFMKKLGSFSDHEAQAEAIEKTVEEQKNDTILDERIQRLMRLVDGVRLKKNGQVSVDSYFAKKFTAEKDYTGSDFGVGQATVWSEMKKRIDETPVKWKDIDDGFETKLDRVIEKTEEAIEEGDRLIADVNGGSHSDMAERVISGLPSLRANLRVLTQTKELINDPDMDTKELKKELKSLWMDYDTSALSFDYSGVDNAGGEDASPMEALSDAAGGGLLSLVTEQPDRISDKGIKQSDIYADYYEQEPDKKEYSDSMSKLADEEEVRLSGVLGSIGGYAIEEFALDNYITKMFTGYTPGDKGAEQDASSEGALNVRSGDADNTETGDVKKEWKYALDYGWEYVIAGGKSDRSNLESVLSRILLLRVVTNFTAIISDGAKRAEAYAAAAAVVGFIGLAFLIRFTQTLILITWAFVESLTDVAALLMGKDVPLIKTSSGVKTTFPEIFLITNSAITDRAKTYGEGRAASFGYREYIWMFLAMTEKKIRLYRVMDLIEMDMKKNGYEGFNFGQCVFDMTVEAGFFYPAKFFTLPAVEKLLERDISGREYLCRIRTGYLP